MRLPPMLDNKMTIDREVGDDVTWLSDRVVEALCDIRDGD